MEDAEIEQILKGGKTACWSCRAQIDASDNFCRVCGKGQGARLPWQYKPWGLIAVTVLGLGPFSLIYLWRTPAVPRAAKPFYAAGIIIFTLFVLERMYRMWTFYQSLLGGAQLY